jgi:hydrogenase nickel incorporation protein HypB
MNRVITIERDLNADVKFEADRFRQWMARRGTLVVNLLSSPGSGKTSLLAATAQHWGKTVRMGVLVGDIATDRDAQRLAPWVPVIQLTTGGACHLGLSLVQRGWEAFNDQAFDFLFIENIGNLVCPSSHDLGEHLRIVMLSTTEGDDKPAKYPKAFRTSAAMVISKTDLLPYVPFSIPQATEDARSIQPNLDVLPVSSIDHQGIPQWCEFLKRQHTLLIHANADNH